MNRRITTVLFLLAAVALAGCRASTGNPEAAAGPTALETTATARAAQAAAAPQSGEAAAPATTLPPAAEGVIAGRTDDGSFFYGDPAAPVTFIEYSDFL